MNKEGNLRKTMIIMFGLLVASSVIALLWDSVPIIKDNVHFILNPTAGALINWNLTIGMILIVFIISLFTTLAQKYTTDQETLRELKKTQKDIQIEMKKHKDDPKKVMELQKSSLPATLKIMELSFRSTMFTIIPLILLFRWFMDYFELIGSPKFVGFITWFWFYLIFAIIFSSILRKTFKVA